MSPPISQHVKTTCITGKKDYAERIFSSQTRHTISQCDPNKEAKTSSSQDGRQGHGSRSDKYLNYFLMLLNLTKINL